MKAGAGRLTAALAMTTRVRAVVAGPAISWAILSGATLASPSAVHEAQALTQANVSLRQAIDLAERRGNGRAISASYQLSSGAPPYYEVRILRADGQRLTRYDLNPNTGKTQDTSEERFTQRFARLKPKSISDTPTSLARAVETAEERAGGKATDASLDGDADRVKYTIGIARLDGTRQQVRIDGSDGRVVSAD